MIVIDEAKTVIVAPWNGSSRNSELGLCFVKLHFAGVSGSYVLLTLLSPAPPAPPALHL